MRNLYYEVSNQRGFKAIAKTLDEAKAIKSQKYDTPKNPTVIRAILVDADKPAIELSPKKAAMRVEAKRP